MSEDLPINDNLPAGDEAAKDDNPSVSYYVNAADEIVFVNEEWSKFAAENDAPELAQGEKVLRTNLWSVMTDISIEHLYRQILERVRAGHEIEVQLRCDGPDTRRMMEMKVTPRGNGEAQFDTKPVWTEDRAPLKVLQKELPRRDYVLLVCSWCNRVELEEDNWVEVEKAVNYLQLFQVDKLPQLSHGICSDCHKTMSEQIKEGKAQAGG